MRVLKYLRGHIPAVALIVLLLVAQSFCELSLPAYTSSIVDTGIQSGGIEYAAPLALTDKTMDGVRLFLSDDDAAAVSAASKINKSRFRKKHPLPGTSYALGRGCIHFRFTVRRGGTCSPSPDRTACCPAPWDSRCTGRPPAPAEPPQAPGTRCKSPAGLPLPAAPPEWHR